MIDDRNLEHKIGSTGYWETKPKGELKDAKKARIAWNLNDAHQISSVLITTDMSEWRAKSEDFEATGGACYANWMSPAIDRSKAEGIPDQIFDVAGVFGTMLSYGFENKGVMREALIGFAGLDAGGFARRMLFAIDGELNEKDLAA
jgi:hypothetical protein